MVHWFSPSGTLGPQKGPGFKPSGVQVKLLLAHLSMSLTWGLPSGQWLVRLAQVGC
jgi:hypothetical protein